MQKKERGEEQIYDVPLDKAQQYGYYDQMVMFVRNMFSKALKTNKSLYFAVLTGCLRISKESIFTGLNNMKILSITNLRFDEHFGFSNNEVLELSFCESFLNADAKVIEKQLNAYLDTTIGIHDYSIRQVLKENYYHGLSLQNKEIARRLRFLLEGESGLFLSPFAACRLLKRSRHSIAGSIS